MIDECTKLRGPDKRWRRQRALHFPSSHTNEYGEHCQHLHLRQFKLSLIEHSSHTARCNVHGANHNAPYL